MTTKELTKKLKSRFLWLNLLAMVIVVIGLCWGVHWGLNVYTHHDEAIPVPNFYRMDIKKARRLMAQHDIKVQVTDSGHNHLLPAEVILIQTPEEGTFIKSGRTIYVTINSLTSPTVSIPDIIDNSSRREAEALLKNMGFNLLAPRMVEGEKDWVYGVIRDGKNLTAGEKVTTEVPICLVIGSGSFYEEDTDMEVVEIGEGDGESEVDEFEPVNEEGQ